MASVDWSARPDQIENLALREVGVRATTFRVLFVPTSIALELCRDS
jgi:hypothetical protein